MDCCGQKIAYFLEHQCGVELSVSKIYQILGEKVNTSSAANTRRTGSAGRYRKPCLPAKWSRWTAWTLGVFAFNAVDIFAREADMLLTPELSFKQGYRFLQHSMHRRLNRYRTIVQTDGGPELKAEFEWYVLGYCLYHRMARPYKENEQAYIESFNRILRKECQGWLNCNPQQISEPTGQVEDFLQRYHYHRPHLAFDPTQPPLK